MSAKISALPVATMLALTGILPIVQSGVTQQATLEQVRGQHAVTWLDDTAHGDGVTGDAAAINAALSALGTLGGGQLRLGGKTYLLDANVSVPANVSIVGLGDASVLKVASNISGLTVSGQGCDLVSFRVTCTGGGVAQDAITIGPYGVANGPPRTRVLHITVESAGRSGIFVAPNTIDGFQHGVLIEGVRATGCQYGIWVHGEYNRVIGCDVFYNTTGIYIPGGNNIVSACTMTGNTTGFWMAGGGNDGHGCIIGNDINHNTTNVRLDNVVANGEPFIGNNIYGAGTSIMLISSTGARFIGGAIDVADLFFDGSVGTQFQNGLWPMGSGANTLHHNYNGHSSKTIFGAGNVTLDGLGDELPYSFPADANQTLTVAQSIKQCVVIAAGTVTAPRTITSALDATIGQRVLVRNNTAQTITWAWASGLGIAIPTGTAMWVGADGTNATKIGAMT